MKLISAAKAKELSSLFKAIDLSKLEIAIFIDEMTTELKYGQHEAFWQEMAPISRGCEPETVRSWVNTVKGYDPDQLRAWTKHGLSFDHFIEAKHIVNWYKPGKTAPEILTDCLVYGGVEGDGIMTVAEMRSLYIKDGNQPFAPKALFTKWMDRLCGFRMPDPSKQARFVELAQEFKDKVQELL